MTYDLEKIEEVCSKATPGPWRTDNYYVSATNGLLIADVGCSFNALFIALARTALPELCARVRELETENAALRADNAELIDWIKTWKMDCDAVANNELPTYEVIDDVRSSMEETLSIPHPGDSLLKELEQLRAVRAATEELSFWNSGFGHSETYTDLVNNLKEALTAAQRPTHCGPGEGGAE